MAIINFETLANREAFNGSACMQSITIAKTKSGNDYVTGNFRYGENLYRYNVWDSHVVEALKPAIGAGIILPAVVNVTGEASSFNESMTFTVRSITFVEDTPELCVSMFLPTLDCASLYQEFCDFVNTNLSAPYLNVLIAINKLPISVFTGEQENPTGKTIQDLFKTNWAASSMHDAIGGGLLSHTLKMLKLGKVLLDGRPEFADTRELILLGIAIHDIGKTQEIANGTYTRGSYTTHLVMGCEYLAMIKPLVVEQLGLDNYNRLLSIVIGHHDKFGTPASTAYALIVHLVDMLESQTTIFQEALAKNTAQISSSGEKFVKYDGRNLYF